jgi:lipopolysaccharide/colanic/teichoic acid biosynthesis glycosyltransferase
MYKNFLKRLIDIILALIGILVFSPIFVLVFIYLCFYNNGSPFFFQKRPGKNEKIFSIIKFKTMNDKKDVDGNLLPDEKRLSNAGKIIRKMSLDELPQLINVIKGDMSLIGPRPLLIPYLELYNTTQKQRHNVKPGITGWAQVNGRNAISWEEKFRLDIWYVNNISFFLDIKIIIKTVLKVLKSEDINTLGEATTLPFKGSKNE